MRFRVIEAEKAKVPVRRSCAILDVSESGFYAWLSREPSQRQRDDMVFLAHVRSQHRHAQHAGGGGRRGGTGQQHPAGRQQGNGSPRSTHAGPCAGHAHIIRVLSRRRRS